MIINTYILTEYCIKLTYKLLSAKDIVTVTAQFIAVRYARTKIMMIRYDGK